MSDLMFSFEGRDVRVLGTAEAPLWVAQDVCACLGLSDTSKSLEPLDPDEKGTKDVRTLGGNQKMLVVTESGLYRLIFKSRKAIAKRFQRWVLHEVLPQIRKTGSYSIASEAPPQTPALPPMPTQQEQLENVGTALSLLDQLGGVDERSEMMLRDLVLNITLKGVGGQLLLTSQEHYEISVSERVHQLGYKATTGQLSSIGKTLARLYRERYGDSPVKRRQLVNGQPHPVNSYTTKDLDLMDDAISQVLGK